jgi:hypothetical protein
MYSWISWESVADPLGSSEYTLGTTALDEWNTMECWLNDMIRENGSTRRRLLTLGTCQVLQQWPRAATDVGSGWATLLHELGCTWVSYVYNRSDNCTNWNSTILTSSKRPLIPADKFLWNILQNISNTKLLSLQLTVPVVCRFFQTDF